ncbi:MAG: hypothetical protein JWN86_2740 [Planctomycetota bacterium]|nr:hypothetical protein [Planctomycetota bacterium]
MSDMRPQADPNPEGRAGHEPSDLNIRALVLFLAALIVMSIMVYFALRQLMARYTRESRRIEQQRPALFADQKGQFPEPRNQVNPRADLARLRDRERSILNSYGWVDREAGVARIPIDRAMTLLAQRGVPTGRTSPPRGSRTREQP